MRTASGDVLRRGGAATPHTRVSSVEARRAAADGDLETRAARPQRSRRSCPSSPACRPRALAAGQDQRGSTAVSSPPLRTRGRCDLISRTRPFGAAFPKRGRPKNEVPAAVIDARMHGVGVSRQRMALHRRPRTARGALAPSRDRVGDPRQPSLRASRRGAAPRRRPTDRGGRRRRRDVPRPRARAEIDQRTFEGRRRSVGWIAATPRRSTRAAAPASCG